VWDTLATKYKDSSVVGVYDVDCTAAGSEALCQKYGVKGYPTIKYFNDKTGKSGAAYNGGRDAAALKTFVDTTFKAKCDGPTGKGCNELELKYIEKTKDKNAEELAEEKKLKEADLKAMKKERSDAEAVLAGQQKKWKSKETALVKAIDLVKQFEKAAKSGGGKKKGEEL